jgi:hypothetical protein
VEVITLHIVMPSDRALARKAAMKFFINTRIWCRYIVSCSAVLSFSSAVFAGDFTIIPGKCVGKTSLGEERSQVLDILGRPSETETPGDGATSAVGSLRTDTWYGKDMDPVLMISYDTNRVVQITTDNPRFRTADGISVDSPLRQIRRHFKHLRHHTDPFGPNSVRTHTHYYDPVAGIAFVNTNGAPNMDVVTIYRPGERVIRDAD